MKKRELITVDVSGYKKQRDKYAIIDALHLLITEKSAGRLKITRKPFAR